MIVKGWTAARSRERIERRRNKLIEIMQLVSHFVLSTWLRVSLFLRVRLAFLRLVPLRWGETLESDGMYVLQFFRKSRIHSSVPL